MANDTIGLIVGLGNPGDQYAKTRHNAGFWFIDALAKHYGGQLSFQSKYKAETAQIQIGGQTVHLLKPQTFMNKSGESVQALTQFYKIPIESVLVAHDELDIPTGAIRLKRGGGHGGHNGLRDIIAKHGNNANFARLRIGIDHPGHKSMVTSHVLNKASMDEMILIERAIDEAVASTEKIIHNQWSDVQQTLHRLPNT